MPLELGVLDRRRFLTAWAAGGVSWLARGEGFAATAAETTAAAAPPGSWALLSDTHIAADLGASRRGVRLALGVERAVAEVLARDAGTAGVIVNGDCAHLHGRADDYRSFAGLVEPLVQGRRPVHLLLGNHDHRDAFSRTCAAAFPGREGPAGRRAALVPSPHLNWFLLDSLEEGRWFAGRLGREQLDWLAAALDRHPDQPAVIMAHHHLDLAGSRFPVFRPKSALADSAELLALMRPRRQVKAYVCGHTHRWETGRTPDGIHLIHLPATAYAFQSDQPTGWVEATPRADGMDLELRSLHPGHPSHGERRRLRWR